MILSFRVESYSKKQHCVPVWGRHQNRSAHSVAMTIFRGGIGRFRGGVRAAVFFFWIVILFFSQLGLHFAVHNNNSNKDASTSSGSHESFTFHSPRKALSLDTASFHAPSSLSQFTVNEDDPDTIYEDDMRVVHTGTQLMRRISIAGTKLRFDNFGGGEGRGTRLIDYSQ
ncbi:hypothetical protein Gohar_009162, partial [Gossypium harknessii]|nr:hypothetical protein [Gossypium harknessii]